jgi:hypothetical protein
MKRFFVSRSARRLPWCLATALVSLLTANAWCATNLFSTHFEAAEGYDGAWTLVGQQGWLGEGTGGNGIVTNFIAGRGQHAFVGYFAPDSTNETQMTVWQPINFNPRSAGLPVVKFSVLMSITDSTTGDWDRFGWDFYNARVERLFSIEFDNDYLDVAYVLDGTNDWVYTPLKFTNEQAFTLSVTMNFASNRWAATMDGQLIATNQPITTVGAELTLGDIDAYWWFSDPAFPGDNYMVFDDYQITADRLPPPPRPRIQMLGYTGNGQALLRLHGQPGARYAIDATTNFTAWKALKTNVAANGSFDYMDTAPASAPSRFYRGRAVP